MSSMLDSQAGSKSDFLIRRLIIIRVLGLRGLAGIFLYVLSCRSSAAETTARKKRAYMRSVVIIRWFYSIDISRLNKKKINSEVIVLIVFSVSVAKNLIFQEVFEIPRRWSL